MKDQEKVVREQKIFLATAVALWYISIGIPLATTLHLNRGFGFTTVLGLIFGTFILFTCYREALQPVNSWRQKSWLMLIHFICISILSLVYVGNIRSESGHVVVEKPNGTHEFLRDDSWFNFSDVVVATFPKKFSIANSIRHIGYFRLEIVGEDFIADAAISQAKFSIPADRETVMKLFQKFGTMHRLKLAINQEIAKAFKKALESLESDQRNALDTLTLKFDRPLKVFEGTKADFDGKRQVAIVRIDVSEKPLPSGLTIKVN